MNEKGIKIGIRMAKKKQIRLKASAGILGTIAILGLGFLKANPEILSTVSGISSQNQLKQSQHCAFYPSWEQNTYGRSYRDKVCR